MSGCFVDGYLVLPVHTTKQSPGLSDSEVLTSPEGGYQIRMYTLPAIGGDIRESEAVPMVACYNVPTGVEFCFLKRPWRNSCDFGPDAHRGTPTLLQLDLDSQNFLMLVDRLFPKPTASKARSYPGHLDATPTPWDTWAPSALYLMTNDNGELLAIEGLHVVCGHAMLDFNQYDATCNLYKPRTRRTYLEDRSTVHAALVHAQDSVYDWQADYKARTLEGESRSLGTQAPLYRKVRFSVVHLRKDLNTSLHFVEEEDGLKVRHLWACNGTVLMQLNSSCKSGGEEVGDNVQTLYGTGFCRLPPSYLRVSAGRSESQFQTT